MEVKSKLSELHSLMAQGGLTESANEAANVLAAGLSNGLDWLPGVVLRSL